MLHVIAEHKGFPHADSVVEAAMQTYVCSGRPLLLLHASSAAFPRWQWWRRLVGLRWVRRDDPDGLPRSRHAHDPFTVQAPDGYQPGLSTGPDLRPMSDLGDELYYNLASEGPSRWCRKRPISRPFVHRPSGIARHSVGSCFQFY